MFHDILTAIKMWLSLCLKSYRIQALSAVNFLIWLLSIYSIDCRILCFYFLLPTGISIVFLDFSFHPIVVQHVLLNCHKLMNFLSFVLSGNINLWCSDRIQDVISFFWCLLRLILDSNMWFILEKSHWESKPFSVLLLTIVSFWEERQFTFCHIVYFLLYLSNYMFLSELLIYVMHIVPLYNFLGLEVLPVLSHNFFFNLIFF